jgi:hypothetical protein
MNNANLLGLLPAPTAVGSGDLLGHWLWFNLLVILLSATAAFVIANLDAVVAKNIVWLQLYEVARGAAAKWASIGWLLNWVQSLKLHIQIIVVQFKLSRTLSRCRKLVRKNEELRRLQINHILLNSGGRSEVDDVFGDVNGIDGHNVNGGKWPNASS